MLIVVLIFYYWIMNIYVGNLNYHLTEEELTEVFAAYGEVLSAKIVKDPETDRAKGFGFVEMSDEAGAQAIEALDGKEIQGRNLKVNQARPKPQRSPRFDRSRRER